MRHTREEIGRRLEERVEVRRGHKVAFEELPDGFAALDGYALGAHVDNARRRYSFDHHEGVLRFSTRATCEQVLDAALLGLDFSNLRLGVNDLDADVVLSLAVALFSELRTPPTLEDVRRMVGLVGAADAHGPAYPLEDPALVRQFKLQVMGSQGTTFKASASYSTAELRERLCDCLVQVLAYFGGERAPVQEIERTFSVLAEDPLRGLVMVESQQAVLDLAYALQPRVVAFSRLPGGSTAYTLARRSEFVDRFPIAEIVARLNELEQDRCRRLGRDTDTWGGASTIAGAPRNADGSRSHLEPGVVWEAVTSCVPEPA